MNNFSLWDYFMFGELRRIFLQGFLLLNIFLKIEIQKVLINIGIITKAFQFSKTLVNNFFYKAVVVFNSF